jgi:hypothetical protein
MRVFGPPSISGFKHHIVQVNSRVRGIPCLAWSIKCSSELKLAPSLCRYFFLVINWSFSLNTIDPTGFTHREPSTFTQVAHKQLMYANGIFSKEVKQGTSHHYLHEKATVTLWRSMRKAGIVSLPFTRSSRTHNTQHQHAFYLITITIINRWCILT